MKKQPELSLETLASGEYQKREKEREKIETPLPKDTRKSWWTVGFFIACFGLGISILPIIWAFFGPWEWLGAIAGGLALIALSSILLTISFPISLISLIISLIYAKKQKRKIERWKWIPIIISLLLLFLLLP